MSTRTTLRLLWALGTESRPTRLRSESCRVTAEILGSAPWMPLLRLQVSLVCLHASTSGGGYWMADLFDTGRLTSEQLEQLLKTAAQTPAPEPAVLAQHFKLSTNHVENIVKHCRLSTPGAVSRVVEPKASPVK
eukprot:m.394786 g.394786  ORF g.394786 m.394786 type:complete len:134 (-) comp56380_c0_seq19:2385-2786(-)